MFGLAETTLLDFKVNKFVCVEKNTHVLSSSVYTKLSSQLQERACPEKW